MGSKFIIVAFYTKDTGYELEIKKLVSSLNVLNLEYDVQGIKNLGSWQKKYTV